VNNLEPQDISFSKYYDGFIGPKGEFYIVKLRRNTMSLTGHNEWAEEFIKVNKLMTPKLSQSYSMLLALSKLNGHAEYLIHCFGFVYYSHDPIYYKPIIILPKIKIFGNKANSSQMETLYNIMKINNEHPENIELFIDSNIDTYIGLDEIGGNLNGNKRF